MPMASLDGGGAGQSRADPELGALLRRLRRGRGLTQRDLKGPLHLGSHTAVAAWEAGRRLPPAGILAAYERYFGLPPGQLARLREQALAERAADDAQVAMAGEAVLAVPVP
jgi:transcriptional regulator with XRE-family HTH domain